MQKVPQIFNAFVGQIPIKTLPVEPFRDITLGLERLHQLEHPKIRNINICVLVEVVFFLGHHHTLFKEVGVDREFALLGD